MSFLDRAKCPTCGHGVSMRPVHDHPNSDMFPGHGAQAWQGVCDRGHVIELTSRSEEPLTTHDLVALDAAEKRRAAKRAKALNALAVVSAVAHAPVCVG